MNFLLDDVIKFRRELHKIPELSFKEYKTQSYIIKQLEEMGYKPEKICDTGVVLYIEGENKAYCKAFRADMDALKIDEATGCEFSSSHEGVMHACGHDGHCATLLAFAKYLTTVSEKKYSILLIFQPAEENIGGAEEICKTGILERYNVKEIYALHLFPELEQGVISTKEGAFFAQPTEFNIKIIGKGGHGGMPHKAIDPLIPFCKAIDSYQTIISRNLSSFSSAVITVGKFSGGKARNIIPNTVEFEGTIRTYSREDTKTIIERISDINKGLEISFGVSFENEFNTLFPPVINDKKLVDRFLLISDRFNFKYAEALTLAEDFSSYQEYIPGVFFLLGTKNVEKGYIHSLHNSKFNFDEKVLLEGVKLFSELYFLEK